MATHEIGVGGVTMKLRGNFGVGSACEMKSAVAKRLSSALRIILLL